MLGSLQELREQPQRFGGLRLFLVLGCLVGVDLVGPVFPGVSVADSDAMECESELSIVAAVVASERR